MYNVANVIGLTKELILAKISDYDIYCHYLGFRPEIGSLYSSPLRSDSNPSFGIFRGRNSSILFKDFGTGVSGDAFKLVKLLYNFKYTSEAIGDIYNTLIKGKPIKTISKINNIPSKKPKRIGIKIMPFNEEGRKYWESYGISLSTLNKFDVNQVKKVYINDEVKDRYKTGNPIFSYTVYDKLKIYKPLSKDFKFYTDCDSNYIQGWKQLDTTKDILIITKALKDVMVLHGLGYTSIAPNGEGYDLPKKAVEFIKKNFKRIIIFYDRDRTGITNSIKLAIKYDLDFILIPAEYNVKDISDFYRKYGKSQTTNILSKLITDEQKTSKRL